MNNKPKLNKYTEDLLSAKRLPLPLREFIISYGGVEKLRRDIWGRYYGEEMVRQKEKGKKQERAERAANRYCQGIMLEMAWKAGYIEERRPTERKVEKNKAVTKEKVTEKVIEYGTTTNIVNEISTDQAAAAVNENVKRRSPLHTVTKDHTKHEEKARAILKAAYDMKLDTVGVQDIKEELIARAEADDDVKHDVTISGTVAGLVTPTEHNWLPEQKSVCNTVALHLRGFKPETTVMAVDALPATTVSHIIPPGEFNPAYWNRGSKYETHVLTFVRPEAAVSLFQRLAVRSSETSLMHMEIINKISPTSAVRVLVQLPILFPVSVPLHKLTSVGMANTSSKERREVFGPLPLLVKRQSNTDMPSLIRHSLSELADVQMGVQMDTCKKRIQMGVRMDKEESVTKDDTNTNDTGGCTALTNIACHEKQKKSLKARIGNGIRKFFRGLCVCGRKKEIGD